MQCFGISDDNTLLRFSISFKITLESFIFKRKRNIFLNIAYFFRGFNFLGKQFTEIVKYYKEGNMESAQVIQVQTYIYIFEVNFIEKPPFLFIPIKSRKKNFACCHYIFKVFNIALELKITFMRKQSLLDRAPATYNSAMIAAVHDVILRKRGVGYC